MNTTNIELARDVLDAVAQEGATRAGTSLTELLGQHIAIHTPSVSIGTDADTCAAVGGPETLVLGSYLSISGDITGHVMLLFPVARALQCVDLMAGQAAGTTSDIDDFARSAVGELGNIVGSAFVNALANHSRLILHPSPPTVVCDMASSLVTSIYAEVLEQGNVVMIDTVFEDDSGNTTGLLVVAPDPECMPRLLEIPA